MGMTYASRHILLGVIAIISLAAVGCGSGSGESSSAFTLSGTITVSGSTAMDSDVNDINTTPQANDTFETPQVLDKNPVILGGYVNVPLQGEAGNSYSLGDEADVFNISLTKNESINLYIAEYGTTYPGAALRDPADLDLYLYRYDPQDDSYHLVDASIGDHAIENVRATVAGTYFIQVKSVSGASNYILTVGQGITGPAIMEERLAEDFKPGEIVVKLRPEARDAFENPRRSLADNFMGLHRRSGFFQGEMVLKIDAANQQEVFRALDLEPAQNSRQLYQADDPGMQLKRDTLRVVDALKGHPDVMAAEPNYIRRPMGEPDDQHYPLQWHYPLVRLPQAWEITTGSPDVIVAVIDTGILAGHPDIDEDRLVDGYDFISDPDISLDGDDVPDDDPEDPGDELEGGSSFHGTHVAGTIGAATNNLIGVAGIARGCKIMPLRALGSGGGLASDIRQAIYYAAGLENKSGKKPTRRADIINLSLGGTSFSELDQQAITAAREAGVIIIAAAGNHAASIPMYPAAYDGVVSVSAVGADKQLAPYSGFGSTVDIAAPGGNMSRDYDGDGHLDGVLSTSGDDSVTPTRMVYHFSQGTSMAAPHVAGVAALMKSIEPALDPDLMDRYIKGEGLPPITQDIGDAGRDDSFGYGMIDAFKAVKAVKTDLPRFLFVSPLTLNFGASQTELELTAQNYNTDEPLTMVTLSENEPWLDIVEPETSFDVDEQFGTYKVTVDRSFLADGPYAATITLESDVNTVEISVSMQVGQPVNGDAGYHYVVLLDPYSYETIVQFDVAAPVNGVYPFSLRAPEGEYILFAGTDSDNDYTVGDSGESAGAYISIDQPRIIDLTRNRADVNFISSFNLNLPTTLTGLDEGYGIQGRQEKGFRINKPLQGAAQAAH